MCAGTLLTMYTASKHAFRVSVPDAALLHGWLPPTRLKLHLHPLICVTCCNVCARYASCASYADCASPESQAASSPGGGSTATSRNLACVDAMRRPHHLPGPSARLWSPVLWNKEDYIHVQNPSSTVYHKGPSVKKGCRSLLGHAQRWSCALFSLLLLQGGPSS